MYTKFITNKSVRVVLLHIRRKYIKIVDILDFNFNSFSHSNSIENIIKMCYKVCQFIFKNFVKHLHYYTRCGHSHCS